MKTLQFFVNQTGKKSSGLPEMFPTSGTDPFWRSLVCGIATKKAKSAESITHQQNLFNQAEETMFNVLTRSVKRSGERGEWLAYGLSPSSLPSLKGAIYSSTRTAWTKKANQKLYQNYRPIRYISHPSEVIMKVVLNRLETKPVNCYRTGWIHSRKKNHKNIFNCVKCLQRQ